MSLYYTEGKSKGYINVPWLMRTYPDANFIFIYGPRGSGKTYGILAWLTEQARLHDQKFFFMRRTTTEQDLLNTEQFFPYKKLNKDKKWNVQISKLTKYNAVFYEAKDRAMAAFEEKNKFDPETDRALAYTGSLSTSASIRGFDGSDIGYAFYDEFIPEQHVRRIKNEGGAFLNAYETINRNRELDGEKPIKFICAANTNQLANPIFMEMNLVGIAESMRKRKINISYLEQRGILLVDTYDSPISEQKKNTALYRAVSADSDFYGMAINNSFSDYDGTNVASLNLNDFDPYASVGDLTIYKHKTLKMMYVSFHKSGTPETYGTSAGEIRRFKSRYGTFLLTCDIYRLVYYENYTAKALFDRYLEV